MTVDEKIYRCWHNGLGIAQTIQAVKKSTGERVTFEQVRLRFVTLADRFR